MRIPFRKNNRDFSESVRKSSTLQHTIGVTGNQSKREVIIDKNGEEFEIGREMKGLEISQEGIPNVSHSVVGQILSCGHTENSMLNVQVCVENHYLCSQHTLNECRVCGSNLCPLDDYFIHDDSYICSKHIKKVIADNILIGFYLFLKNGVLSFFGFETEYE